MKTNMTNETEQQVELTYGELTMIKLAELLGETAPRNAMPVSADFWDWRKENKSRASVLNKAGLALNKTEDTYGRSVWTADLTAVNADSLDEARDNNIKWKRTEKEIAERARIYLRQCDRMKYAPGGQFGGPVPA
jgi:hypothetical protein